MEKGGGGGGGIQQRNTGFVAYKIVARCQVNILDRFNKQSRKKKPSILWITKHCGGKSSLQRTARHSQKYALY